MRYHSRILLTLIFALLQCVAPLVHAHVDGQLSGILPPSLEIQYLPDHTSVKASDSIVKHESPAITISDEFKTDSQRAVARPSLENILNIPRIADAKYRLAAVAAIIVVSSYYKPHPQAPPALT